MTFTRVWKVYGVSGHRQRVSFRPSFKYDFSSKEDGVRIIEVFNEDVTGTNEYSVIKITRSSYVECEYELLSQLSDGIFENSRTGKVVEVSYYHDNPKFSAFELERIIEKVPDFCKKICFDFNDLQKYDSSIFNKLHDPTRFNLIADIRLHVAVLFYGGENIFIYMPINSNDYYIYSRYCWGD